MKKNGYQILLPVTVMIWGSLYVAGRAVMEHMPALFLLFLRFSVSAVLLLGLAGAKKIEKIRREDRWEMFLVGFLGYFLSNAALLLGIQYSNASFASLINAMSPIFISIFAVLLLGEKMDKRDIISLFIAVAGAVIIIGNPGDSYSVFGILSSIVSLIVWSYTMIHIKKLTAKYDPVMVTGCGMGIAAVLSLPASLLYMKVSGEAVEMRTDLILPVLYICVICTAVSHVMWNYALKRTDATKCAAYYPIQPLTSMVLGILLLHEHISMNFILGAVLVLAAMAIHASPGHRFSPGS